MTVAPDFFDRPVLEVARALIGCRFLVENVGGIIVETEAYHAGDPAAHSFVGPRPRTATMFGPAGRLYVYRSYGLHWCANIVGGAEEAAAVLIRAIEPVEGVPAMAARRGTNDPRLLCAGPGRLCQALAITGAMDGLSLDTPPLALLPRATEAEPALLVGPRIGISKGVDSPWRLGLKGSRFLSRRFSES